MKDAVLLLKAEAKPIMPVTIGSSEDKVGAKGRAATTVEAHETKTAPKDRDGKEKAVDIENPIKNPFPLGHYGLCPKCSKAVDVSTFTLDQRNRIYHKECKTQSDITD